MWSSLSSMYLTIDSTLSKGNPKCTLIPPLVIPWINTQPMINTPSNNFNSMSSQSTSLNMLINSTLISQEIFIDSESSSNSSVSKNIILDFIPSTKSITRSGLVLIIIITLWINTLLTAFRSYLLYLTTILIIRIDNMMITLWHSIRETGTRIIIISSTHYSCRLKPSPRITDLSSITTLRHTVKESATSSSISRW